MSIDEIKEASMNYGQNEHFETLIKIINKINSLKSLLENSNNFYPVGYSYQYQKDLKELIKLNTMSLNNELKRLSLFYNNFNFRGDKE